MLVPTPPEQHHHISADVHHKVDILKWVTDNHDDPALTVCTSSLLVKSWYSTRNSNEMLEFYTQTWKDHLLSWLVENDESNCTFTYQDWMSLKLINDWIYQHKVLWVNYTTYNVQWDQDSLNPCTHGDIMVLSRGDEHPYWYAHIIGIFHVMVLQIGQKSRCKQPRWIFYLFNGLDLIRMI